MAEPTDQPLLEVEDGATKKPAKKPAKKRTTKPRASTAKTTKTATKAATRTAKPRTRKAAAVAPVEDSAPTVSDAPEAAANKPAEPTPAVAPLTPVTADEWHSSAEAEAPVAAPVSAAAAQAQKGHRPGDYQPEEQRDDEKPVASRRRTRGAGVLVAVLTLTLLAALLIQKQDPASPEAAPLAVPAHEAEAAPERSAIVGENRLPHQPEASRVGDSSTVAEAAEPASDLIEATIFARQLVATLSQWDPGRGLPPDQEAILREGFQSLATRGVAAVKAIGEYLERYEDLSFEDLGLVDAIGYRSVRAGLIDVLQQIGGPEALALTLKTLNTTAEPAEVAVLARSLEQRAPGKYRAETLQATRETLAMAARGELGQMDVAPLFHLLQLYGDADALPKLAKEFPQWTYYSAIAMASLPDGQGIPMLARMAQAEWASTVRHSLALRLLAQAAGEHPEAAPTLIALARSRQIPASTWDQIASGLAGDQYRFGSRLLDQDVPAEVEAGRKIYPVHPNQNVYSHSPDSPVPGLRTYHVEESNQNFYSVPIPPELPADEIGRRIRVIDQLLATNSSGPGTPALREARLALVRRLSR